MFTVRVKQKNGTLWGGATSELTGQEPYRHSSAVKIWSLRLQKQIAMAKMQNSRHQNSSLQTKGLLMYSLVIHTDCIWHEQKPLQESIGASSAIWRCVVFVRWCVWPYAASAEYRSPGSPVKEGLSVAQMHELHSLQSHQTYNWAITK